jgi:hypothetical protein
MLTRVGREEEADPSRFVLRASVIHQLRQLIESRAGIDVEVKQAGEELNEAQQLLCEAKAALQDSGGTEENPRERERRLGPSLPRSGRRAR